MFFIYFITHVTFNLLSVFDETLIIFYLFFIHVTFWKDQKVTKKSPLLKKLNGSVSNQFATCSASGNSLRSNILRQMLQVPFYFKFSPVFWKSRPAVTRTFSVLYFECRGSVQIHSFIIASKILTCYHTKNIFYISNLIILLSESNTILF